MKKWQIRTLQVIALIVILVLYFGNVCIYHRRPLEMYKTNAMLAEIEGAMDERKAMNPAYDLRSTGGSIYDLDVDQSKWITNWQSY